MVAKDGPLSLYRGFGISVVGVFVYRGAYFGLFDTARSALFSDPRKANVFEKWLLAQVVVLAAGCISYPLDTLRARSMMQAGREASEIHY